MSNARSAPLQPRFHSGINEVVVVASDRPTLPMLPRDRSRVEVASALGSNHNIQQAEESVNVEDRSPSLYFQAMGGAKVSVKEQHVFACKGSYHTVDIFPERCREMNSHQPYTEVLARECNYMMPVPWEPFYFTHFKEGRLDFMLDTESLDLTEFIKRQTTHNGSFQEYRPVEFKMVKSQVASVFELQEQAVQHDGYHLLPLLIELVDVDSTLPISLNVELHTSRARKEGSNTTDPRPVIWRSRHCKGALNGSSDAFKTGSQFSNSLIIAPDAKSVPEKMCTVYSADETPNDADFPRWICARHTHLLNSFNALRAHAIYDGVPAWLIRCPKDSDRPESNTDALFWFIATNFEELVRRTNEFGTQVGRKVDSFNKVTEDQTGEPFIWVVKKVVEDMLKIRAQVYDRDKLLMNVNEVKLVIQPLLRQQGWEDLRQIAEERSKIYPKTDPNNTARLRLSFRVVYQEYQDKEAERELTGH